MDGSGNYIYIDDDRKIFAGYHTIIAHPNEDEDYKYLAYLFLTDCWKSQIRSRVTGIKLFSISQKILREVSLILPSKKIRKEIVEYLDKKIPEIDSLITKKEAFVAEMETYKKSLIYEYVTGKKEVAEEKIISFPAVVNCKKKRFAQAVLIAKILDIFGDSYSGRVKVAKTLYIIENYIGFDFETDTIRQVAGPLDKQYYEAEAIVRHNKWFNVLEDKSNVKYFDGSEKDKYCKYYDKYFKEYDSEIQRIIRIFVKLNMNEAELLATAYASWNDFIIKGESFTTEKIVEDIFSWDDSKKRFSKEQWINALKELEIKKIIPVGNGRVTVFEKR